MSYFDHVQCHSCGARLDPEQLQAPREGGMPSCPRCNTSLNLTDLFGVKDSFVGLHDDQGNDHTLDDLLTNDLYDGRYVDGRAPSAPQAPPQRQAPQRSAARTHNPPQRSGKPSLRQLTGSAPASNSGALVRSGRQRDAWEDDEDEPQDAAPSAADLLRSMKKRR